jgi:hypothetical protein
MFSYESLNKSRVFHIKRLSIESIFILMMRHTSGSSIWRVETGHV